MKKIKEGIVFSNDIERIMEGNNALNYSYEKQGMVLPDKDFYKMLREDFSSKTSTIFNGCINIIDEEDMLNGLLSSINDVYGSYPHCLLR